MKDFNWEIPEGTNYTGRNLSEICETAREEFFNKNGFYPTPEEALILIEEAKEEIKQEKLKRGANE